MTRSTSRYYAYFYAYIEENHKKEKSQVLKAMNKESSSVRDRLASYEVEKMLHELTTTSKSDEYLKTEGCGGELRKMESEEEDFRSDSPSGSRGENPETEEGIESRSRYRRQSSIVGFDSENFPFKSLADFLPDLRAEEEDVSPRTETSSFSGFYFSFFVSFSAVRSIPIPLG